MHPRYGGLLQNDMNFRLQRSTSTIPECILRSAMWSNTCGRISLTGRQNTRVYGKIQTWRGLGTSLMKLLNGTTLSTCGRLTHSNRGIT